MIAQNDIPQAIRRQIWDMVDAGAKMGVIAKHHGMTVRYIRCLLMECIACHIAPVAVGRQCEECHGNQVAHDEAEWVPIEYKRPMPITKIAWDATTDCKYCYQDGRHLTLKPCIHDATWVTQYEGGQ